MLPTGKNRIILSLAFSLLLIAGLVYWLINPKPEPTPEPTSTEEVEETPFTSEQVIGQSVEGRSLKAYTFGNGETSVLLVGGMHGGYEWNSSLLAYQMMDYLTANPEVVPEDITVTIVPVANPDGLFAVTGSGARFAVSDVVEPEIVGTGRFNANGVDLNRNFDCKWQPESSWRGETVSAGANAFSEPEAAAIRDLVYEIKPSVVVFWHSQANAVYASECEAGVLPETIAAMNNSANNAGYKSVESFEAYPVSGDAEGWLASIGIPAITVELATHKTIEWEANLAGTLSLINHFSAAK